MSIKLAPHDSARIPSDKLPNVSNESSNPVYQKPTMNVQSLDDKSFGRTVTPEVTSTANQGAS